MAAASSAAAASKPLSTGSFMRASNTKAGHSIAMAHYQKYLDAKQFGKFEDQPEKDLCDPKRFEDFALYLTNLNEEKAGAERAEGEDMCAYKVNTLEQYLSGAKTVIKNRHPANEIWRTEETWYKNIRAAMGRHVSRFFITRGLSLTDKSTEIGREALKEISKELILSNKARELFLLVMTWHSIGRAGEVAFVSWDNCFWDLDNECLVMT
jgi:hypothetical protein